MKVSAALPPGVAALFFDAARQRRLLEGELVARLERAGFEEAILPVLDFLEPYEPLLTPAGRAELYRFSDRGGDPLALRADFTPMLARLLAPRLSSLALPLRLFYCGDVVRYQEVQAGSERESYQLGAELLGLPGEAAEEEVLRLFLELLAAAGLDGVTVVLGFAGALDELLLRCGAAGREGCPPPAQLAAAVSRRERRPARQASAALLEVVEEGFPRQVAELGESAAERLLRLQGLCQRLNAVAAGIELKVDLAEFARFTLDPRVEEDAGRRSYYDGLVFRAFVPESALPLGGGGRYDQLFRLLGAEVPAAGFYLALDRILRVRAVRSPS